METTSKSKWKRCGATTLTFIPAVIRPEGEPSAETSSYLIMQCHDGCNAEGVGGDRGDDVQKPKSARAVLT